MLAGAIGPGHGHKTCQPLKSQLRKTDGVFVQMQVSCFARQIAHVNYPDEVDRQRPNWGHRVWGRDSADEARRFGSDFRRASKCGESIGCTVRGLGRFYQHFLWRHCSRSARMDAKC